MTTDGRTIVTMTRIIEIEWMIEQLLSWYIGGSGGVDGCRLLPD